MRTHPVLAILFSLILGAGAVVLLLGTSTPSSINAAGYLQTDRPNQEPDTIQLACATYETETQSGFIFALKAKQADGNLIQKLIQTYGADARVVDVVLTQVLSDVQPAEPPAQKYLAAYRAQTSPTRLSEQAYSVTLGMFASAETVLIDDNLISETTDTWGSAFSGRLITRTLGYQYAVTDTQLTDEGTRRTPNRDYAYVDFFGNAVCVMVSTHYQGIGLAYLPESVYLPLAMTP